MTLAWIVLAISAIILIAFILFLFIDCWQAALFSFVVTTLLVSALYGLEWALSVLRQ